MFRKGKKRHSSNSSQSSEVSTKSKSIDSSLGGLSRSSTVGSLDTDSAASSGTASSTVNIAEFRVRYLGVLEHARTEYGVLHGPADIINCIDLTQQSGRLPFVASEEEVIFIVTKHGIKVTAADRLDVLQRLPLYLIMRMVCFDDGFGMGKHLLAVKTTEPSETDVSLWIYQCSSLEQGQAMCRALSSLFDSTLRTEKS
uniref:Integrin beta-1-binding protein 1 n=1 Tax=Eptatretus burgeri TaxID=7764 RepID=A0A8C4QUM3_EPTBU